ncbi:polyamine ABC transporter substrate-binding protein [Pseudomaricurvus sp. HS19]|uniref:polyamine ABC transporter substrate-binding protein n=1 Tax=Pseudomaricurvus sp. HS19 TaxID=2692626 RepID=UPI001370E6CC|nr:polyamine ABC transporter substrate-binding protein [Pseudomaricurvus sp. HS19]MYM63903.1 extracellular solute-binding protein [Pseudomaricurvus sp. HS19]
MGFGKLFPALTLTCVSALAVAEAPVLHLYNWSDYFAPETIEEFEKKTGIKVQYDTYDSNEVLETKLLTGNSGYDLVFPAASNAVREFQAGALSAVEHTRLQNRGNLEAVAVQQLSQYEGGDRFGVPYTWGTTGVAYNVEKIEARMPDAPVNSLDILFKPELVSRFADCGVALLDSPLEVTSIALNYLGFDPYSNKREEIDQAAELIRKVRPHIRYFGTQQMIQDLAAGDICLAMVYSGDAGLAQIYADEAENGVQVGYAIPVEGTGVWYDVMAIPADAPNPDLAYAFIDYVLQPEVIAGITNYTWFANPNREALALVDEEIRTDPNVYPSEEVRSKLFVDLPLEAKNNRYRNRQWTAMKSGQ